MPTVPNIANSVAFATGLFATALFAAAGASGAVDQAAYVWQRDWTPRVAEAVVANSDRLAGLTILAAEIRPSPADSSVARIEPDYPSLRKSGLPVTLAVRVGTFPGPYDAEEAVTRVLLQVVDDVLADARAHGIEPAALEIDFDCATAKLEGYRSWLRLVHSRLGDTPLSITTLPTWMSRPQAFGALVAEADRFVLQVHSIRPPETPDAPIELCDSDDTLRWTRKAGQFGVPFTVALPTYGYRLAFDGDGKLIEVAGEDASAIERPDRRYRVVRSSPETVARIVSALADEHPASCRGLVWYRLPVGDERFNWDPETWHTVMAGDAPAGAWAVEAAPQPDGAIEIRIRQQSAVALPPPREVRLAWSGAQAVAWDGQRHYTVREADGKRLVWSRPSADDVPPLPRGTNWTLGWVRMDGEAQLELSLGENES